MDLAKLPAMSARGRKAAPSSAPSPSETVESSTDLALAPAVVPTSDTTPIPVPDGETPAPRSRRKQVPVLADEEIALRPSIAELLEKLPTEPGVYLMKDKRGRVIYVGKAKSLKNLSLIHI